MPTQSRTEYNRKYHHEHIEKRRQQIRASQAKRRERLKQEIMAEKAQEIEEFFKYGETEA